MCSRTPKIISRIFSQCFSAQLRCRDFSPVPHMQQMLLLSAESQEI